MSIGDLGLREDVLWKLGGGGGKKDYMMVGIGETGKQVHVIHYYPS